MAKGWLIGTLRVQYEKRTWRLAGLERWLVFDFGLA